MDFFNIPEPKSFQRIQDEHACTQEQLLNEIKEIQQEQMQLLNKMQSDSKKQSIIEQNRFIVSTVISVSALIAAVVAAVAAIIPLT